MINDQVKAYQDNHMLMHGLKPQFADHSIYKLLTNENDVIYGEESEPDEVDQDYQESEKA